MSGRTGTLAYVTYFGLEFTGRLPVLQGRLDKVLPERFHTLPDEAVQRICSLPSYPEALAETVRLLHGPSPYVFADGTIGALVRVVWPLDDIPDALTKVSPLDPTPEPGMEGMIGSLSASSEDIDDWNTWNQRTPAHFDNRRDLLFGTLWNAAVLPRTLDDCLLAGVHRRALWRTHLRAGLGLWWQRTLAQGHTFTSAQTLLALILTPDTLDLIDQWPHEGDRHGEFVLTTRRRANAPSTL